MVLMVGVVFVVMRVGKAVRMGMRVRAGFVRAAGVMAVAGRRGVLVIVVVHGAGVPCAGRRVNRGVIA